LGGFGVVGAESVRVGVGRIIRDMRRIGALVVAALVVVPITSSAGPPVVPISVQAAIVKLAPARSYVPTRVPTGWRFKSFKVTGGAVSVTFAHRLTGKRIVTFRVRSIKPSANCLQSTADHMQTMGGNRVWVGVAGTTTIVWRCVTTPAGGTVILSAESNENVSEYGLGRLVASGKRVS
jgi:hypothetical protein